MISNFFGVRKISLVRDFLKFTPNMIFFFISGSMVPAVSLHNMATGQLPLCTKCEIKRNDQLLHCVTLYVAWSHRALND